MKKKMLNTSVLMLGSLRIKGKKYIVFLQLIDK